MKASFSTLTGLAVTAMLAAAALSGCSGGGSTTVPTNPAAVQAPTSGNGSAPIGTLDLMHPASSVPVQVTSRTPAGPTIDVRDKATNTMSSPSAAAGPSITDSAQHGFAGNLHSIGTTGTSSTRRSARDVASNAPYDLSYHGGPVLGSAVSHNLFLNCDANCRASENFNPGQFLSDLNNDPFITVLYQYLTTPGVIDTAPVTGSYPKGQGLLVNDTYQSPRPNSTNQYYGQLKIALAVLNASQQSGMGGGGDGNIYHVFLPQNIDTCFEQPLGTPTTTCYSPDNGNTFFFCAYHGSFFATVNNVRTRFLYTAEPYQDVNGCRNSAYSQPLPNAAGNIDPADPGYSTLSHELFETISDPHLNAWYNNFSGGQEIGDICAEFDNFVTVSGNKYVLQSEYSDLHHTCVSGNLTSTANTPQQGPY